VDIQHLREWLSRTESADDQITATPIAALSATLNRDHAAPHDGDPLPPLWHWLYFLPIHRQDQIGHDGHPLRGGFLPPVPLPRRMWAGSRLQFHHPLRRGEKIARLSKIVDISHKEGRSGPLVFVLVRHEIGNQAGVAITEEHDIVYRGNPRPDDPPPKAQPAPDNALWSREIHPDDVLLFRYSALTFNGHRIHYDRRYVTEVEGYPGLVVHGPLIATLLLDLLHRHMPDASVAAFQFRAVKPLFDIASFFVCGRPEPDGKTIRLWARDRDGALTMDATATLADRDSSA
jgi:3-methylfumaryl-CoA hydratase